MSFNKKFNVALIKTKLKDTREGTKGERKTLKERMQVNKCYFPLPIKEEKNTIEG